MNTISEPVLGYPLERNVSILTYFGILFYIYIYIYVCMYVCMYVLLIIKKKKPYELLRVLKVFSLLVERFLKL